MVNNSLAVVNPELAKQWHPFRNGDLKPTDVTVGSNRKVWWWLPYDDPKTGKHFDFEWPAIVKSRSAGNGCPYLSSRNSKAWKGFNDLATVNPEIAKEWHPFKNGDLKPTDVTFNSIKKVWWWLPYDDPKTRKHYDFEWEATVSNRTAGNGCPYLSGRAVWPGFNDLATVNPKLAKEWHPFRNGDLKPTEVTAFSHEKVWWYLPYDDAKTGKHYDFEWEDIIETRNSGIGCPYLTGARVWVGYNDLATTNPELAREWHPTKNGNLKPEDVTAGSHQKVWWLFPYDDPKTGKHFNFAWEATIDGRSRGNGCPYLSIHPEVWKGFNDLKTLNPELAREWHPTRNGNLKPTDVTVSSGQKVWWYLPYDDPKTGKHFDFEWPATVHSRSKGNGCPYLTGSAVWPGFNDLATTHQELAREWHPTKNGNLKPTDVTYGSTKKVWWYLPYDDLKTGKHYEFEWEAPILSRSFGNGCPYISTSKTERLVCEYLQNKGLEFVGEKRFNHKSVIKYRYDIYIPSLKLIIEPDGEQHFKENPLYRDKLEDRVKRDNIKNEFCYNNNIPILRIPYFYNLDKDTNKIIAIIESFIKTRKVPEKIIELYKKKSKTNYADIALKLNAVNR